MNTVVWVLALVSVYPFVCSVPAMEVLAIEDLKSTKANLFASDGCASAAQAARDAKRKLEAIRNRCQNSLHSCAKLIEDADVVTGIRLITHLMEPYADDYGKVAAEHKGQIGNQKFFCNRANHGVIASIIQSFKSNEAVDSLEKMGFSVSFTKD